MTEYDRQCNSAYSSTTTGVHRVRFVLEVTRAVSMPPLHGPVLYAFLANAYGQASDASPALPDGLMINAPEQCRTTLRAGEQYAFGVTSVGAADSSASIHTLIEGLARMEDGKTKPRPHGLGGNYRVNEVRDLIAGTALADNAELRMVSTTHITRESARLDRSTRLTLRFTSPLRLDRPRERGAPGHVYMDSDYFDAQLFVGRLLSRLRRSGIEMPSPIASPVDQLPVRCEANRLVWLNVPYGPQHRRKSLGGAIGRVVFTVESPALIPALVWGQYLHVGRNTRFGFGSYRIEELGEDPFACERSKSLVELSYTDATTSRLAAEADLPAGELQHDVQTIYSGRYAPDASHRFVISDGDGQPRTLSVPSLRDRALQRGLARYIADGLDTMLSSSSFAYRRGLGRHQAASVIQRAYQQGYRYAVRADFRRFFESVDHQRLRDRLDAFIADDATVELIMRWVCAGSPDQGLPTGAPLSPLLANVFLDQFDQRIGSEAGRLVRYADDFFILFQNRKEADRWYNVARIAADSLALKLNENKSQTIDLREPFEFLGFHFERRGRWEVKSLVHPQPLEDLGWCDARIGNAGLTKGRIHLPHEVEQESSSLSSLLLLGQEACGIDVVNHHLVVTTHDGAVIGQHHLEQVDQVLALGLLDLTGRAINALSETYTEIAILRPRGGYSVLLSMDSHPDAAETICAQVDAARDMSRRLEIARRLLAAKIHNYLVLITTMTSGGNDSKAQSDIERALKRVNDATTIQTLLGIEGSASRTWFTCMRKFICDGFHFARRVAPNADDPVNVMLNIAYSLLHRQAVLAARLAGLSPCLGILHLPRSGHAALASDLQEPFRYVIDRAVIELTHTLHPRQFIRDTRGPWPLRIESSALRRLAEHVSVTLAYAVRSTDSSEPMAYRRLLIDQARSLRRAVTGQDELFKPWRHPR